MLSRLRLRQGMCVWCISSNLLTRCDMLKWCLPNNSSWFVFFRLLALLFETTGKGKRRIDLECRHRIVLFQFPVTDAILSKDIINNLFFSVIFHCYNPIFLFTFAKRKFNNYFFIAFGTAARILASIVHTNVSSCFTF